MDEGIAGAGAPNETPTEAPIDAPTAAETPALPPAIAAEVAALPMDEHAGLGGEYLIVDGVRHLVRRNESEPN